MYRSKNFLDVNALCPFYISEYKKSITCEGMEDEMETMLRFREEEDKDYFVQRYCMKNYEECPYAKNIKEKYIEECIGV